MTNEKCLALDARSAKKLLWHGNKISLDFSLPIFYHFSGERESESEEQNVKKYLYEK
jgi:hypothetical protein